MGRAGCLARDITRMRSHKGACEQSYGNRHGKRANERVSFHELIYLSENGWGVSLQSDDSGYQLRNHFPAKLRQLLEAATAEAGQTFVIKSEQVE